MVAHVEEAVVNLILRRRTAQVSAHAGDAERGLRRRFNGRRALRMRAGGAAGSHAWSLVRLHSN